MQVISSNCRCVWNQKTNYWHLLSPDGTTLYKSYTRRKDPDDPEAPLGVLDWWDQQNG